jgi:hypothetical protein
MARLLNPREEVKKAIAARIRGGDSVFAISKRPKCPSRRKHRRGIETVPLPKSGFYSPTATPLQVLAKFAKSFRGLDVAPCPSRDVLLFVEGELATDFRRRSEDERAGRNFHPNRDECVCPDNGSCTYFYIVENDRAHSDKHFIANLARMDDGVMADRNQFTHSGGIIRVEMDDSIVLNVRARTDDDAVYVAAQNGAVPNAGFFFECDVANYRRARDNPDAGMDRGTFFQTRGDACVSSRE